MLTHRAKGSTLTGKEIRRPYGETVLAIYRNCFVGACRGLSGPRLDPTFQDSTEKILL